MRFDTSFVAFAASIFFGSTWSACAATVAEPTTPVIAMPRVRSEDPQLSAAIAQVAERSPTFRKLLDAINATDGLIYVSAGRCTQGVRACLHMTLHVAGPYRLLRILVDPRRVTRCELVALLGHELQHAFEVLANPHVRSSPALVSFFHQIGPTENRLRFETDKAFEVESAVGREACDHL